MRWLPIGSRLHAGLVIKVQRLNSPPHRATHQHEFHEFILVLAGNYDVEIDGEQHCLDAHHTVLHPAGCRHTPTIRVDLWIMMLQWDDSVYPATRLTGLSRLGTDTGGGIRQCLLWLETWAANAAVPQHDCSALIQVIMRHHADSQQQLIASPLQRAEQQLRSNLSGHMTFAGLARNVGMSRTHLGRLFRERYGISPMAYRRQCRLDRAIELLQAGGMRLAEIATEVGFASAAHLSNQLKADRDIRPRDITRP